MSGRLSRFEAALAALLLAGASATSLPAAVASAGSSSRRIPAQLLVLEQRMRSLSIHSERLVRRGAVRFPSGSTKIHSSRGERKSRLRKHRIVTQWQPSTVEEVSRSPLRGVIRRGARGHRRVELIQVGDQEYVRNLFKKAKRRWIRIPLHKRWGGLAEIAGKGPWSLIGRLESELAHAESAMDLGSAVVLGHQTTEFRVRTSEKETARLIVIRGSREAAQSKTIHRHRRISLRVFIEPSGLPVRIEEDSSFGGGALRLETDTDVLATEIPVHVQAPPKRETITLAELEHRSKNRSSAPPKAQTTSQSKQ